jgi:hypothetical protein
MVAKYQDPILEKEWGLFVDEICGLDIDCLL